jgi:hypothetical protein
MKHIILLKIGNLLDKCNFLNTCNIPYEITGICDTDTGWRDASPGAQLLDPNNQIRFLVELPEQETILRLRYKPNLLKTIEINAD